jgi:6-phosphogluconate dehydrogenase (decarboxylating)
VANAGIQELKQQFSGQSLVTVGFTAAVDAAKLAQIPDVQQVKDLGKNRWQLAAAADSDIRAALFAFAVQHQYTLIELHKETFSVEDIFQQLTK